MPIRKPLTLWQMAQRTPPFMCMVMAVKPSRKHGVKHRTIEELVQRSGIKRRTLQALAYRREWPLLLKTISDFAEACGVNLIGRDPCQRFRRLTKGVSVKQLLRPKQRRGVVRLAKEVAKKP